MMIDEKVQEAQRVTGAVMLLCIPSWWAPIVSGVLCNMAEKKMAQKIVKIMLGREDDALGERLFWFHRKRFLLVDIATYLPGAGPAFQIIEAYSLGQFAIRFLHRYGDRVEEVALREVWASVEADMHSAPRVIESFHEFTGQKLPEVLVGPVTYAVEKFHAAMQTVHGIPYLDKTQEWVGSRLEDASHAVSGALGAVSTAARTFFKVRRGVPGGGAPPPSRQPETDESIR